jgi:hypothetical protein
VLATAGLAAVAATAIVLAVTLSGNPPAGQGPTVFTLHKRGTPGELHGRARVFTITSGGKEYFVQMTALAATWDRSQPIFNAFFATFRPAT